MMITCHVETEADQAGCLCLFCCRSCIVSRGYRLCNKLTCVYLYAL